MKVEWNKEAQKDLETRTVTYSNSGISCLLCVGNGTKMLGPTTYQFTFTHDPTCPVSKLGRQLK